jgi:cell division protein FtsB
MRLAAVVLFLLFAATQRELWSSRGGIPSVLDLQSRIALQMEQNAKLRERNQALDAEVQDLKQGLAAVEERARSEMGMIKQGEIFYQIIETSGAAANSEQLTADR